MAEFVAQKKGRRGLKAIEAEFAACKARWGAECKVSTALKGTEGAPWPITITRTIPAPYPCAYDVDQVTFFQLNFVFMFSRF